MLKYFQFGGAVLASVLAASIYFAWRAAQQEQTQLRAELKVTQQALADATERQKTRDEALNLQLGKLLQQKAAVTRPDQILRALPEVLPLPQPLTFIQSPSQKTSSDQTHDSTGGPSATRPGTNAQPPSPAAKVEIPAADLKPLYDFAVDCKACQARLAAAHADLADEQTKTRSLSRERDDALRMARGGSVVRRIVRAAKWFVIGAAAGAVAVKLAR